MTGEVLREVRTALRGLVRRPGFTLLAILTVVLGVGSVTAAYGLLHQVVLRPLPYESPDELVVVRSWYGDQMVGVGSPAFHLLRDSEVFASMGAVAEPYLMGRQAWTDRDTPEVLHAVQATPGLFPTLGVAPARGPGFSRDGSRAAEVILSHRFWQNWFGGAPDVVGRSMEINGTPHTVVGVLPASFSFPVDPEPFDVWISHHPPTAVSLADSPAYLRVVGRAPGGRSAEEARAEVLRTLDEMSADLAEITALSGFLVRSVKEDLVGDVGRPLLLLFLGAGLVLLVAALNLALLVAARNLERGQEIRIRVALGAGRGRLVRHLMMEAGVLAVVGGGLAVLLATLGLEALLEGGLAELVRAESPGSLGAMALFGLAAALVPALVAAGIPALRVSGSVRALGSRGGTGSRSSRRAATVLTGVEACLVFVLLVATTLTLRSLHQVTRVDPGFDAESTLGLQLRAPDGRYDDPESFTELIRRMEERLRAVPGVQAAGTITNLPLAPASWAGSFYIEGRTLPGEEITVDWEVTSGGYFEAAGIPMLRGRSFGPDDGPDAPRVVVINETLAERYWPDSDPVGARISGTGPEGPWQTVVGVVGDVKQQGLAQAETRGFMYVPASQLFPWPERELVIRTTSADPASVAPAVRSALRELEPGLVIGEVRTLDTLVRDSSSSFRLRAVLFGTFGILALLLGMAGIYGVAAHGVRSARREIGIRMAVGADGASVARRTLASGITPVAGGIAVGSVVALLGGRLLEGFLFGVAPSDPTLLGATALFLLAAGAGAVLPTALRARRVDPAHLLREE